MKVVMGVPNWWEGAVRVHSHHFARLFSQVAGASVLYISHPISPFHILIGSGEARKKARFWVSGPRKVGRRILAYTPMALYPRPRRHPVLGSEWMGENWLRFTFPKLSEVIRQVGFSKPDILMVSDPLMTKLADMVEPRLFVYFIAEDNTDHTIYPKWCAKLEEEFARKCKVVAYPTIPLGRRAVEIASHATICYTPHGVEYEHFRRPRPSPPEYASIPKPIAVYVGLLEAWVDIDLIAYCARKLPKISFVIIGPVKVSVEKLRNLSNVFLLGPRPYETIPAYLQHADVGLICLKPVPKNRYARPVKLFEYMAAGLPVVATRNPAIEAEKAPILMADSFDDFVDSIQRALECKERNVFREFVRDRSWENSFKTLYSAIKEALGG